MELGPALNDDGDIYDRCGNFVGHMSDLRTSSGVFELADLQKKTNQASHVTFHSDDLTEDEGDFALKLQNVTNLADLDSSPEMFLLKRQHSSDKRSDIEVTSPSRPSIKRNLTGAPAAKRHYHAADSSPILGSWGKPQTSSTSETKFAKDKKDKSLLESTLGTGNGEEPAFRSETNHATTQMSMPLTWSSSPAYHKYATLANRNAPQTNDVASKDTHNTDARLKASVTEENLSLSTCGPAEPTRFIRHDSETGVVAEQLAEDKMDPYDNDGGNTVYDGAIAGEDFYPEEPIMATSSELVRRPDINEPIGVTQVTEHASRHFKANPTYDHQNGTHVENIQCAQPKMYKGEDKQIFLGKRTKGGQSRLQTYFSETSKERGLENLERENKASEELATKHPIAKIFLSREQKCILDMVVKEQRNVFFTGAAGTGKSVLLRKIISDLKKKYSKNPNYVAVTASTGLAACNIGGITLHSFAGIGLGTDPVDRLVTKVRRNRKIFQRWKDVKVLIVDELSMIDGALLDKLNDLAQRLRRKKGIPFGGIQIVVTGDFFQLPPVVKDAEELRFAFEADCWNEIVDDTMVLTQVFRQKDNRFSTMLNEMRRGQMSDETVRTLQSLNRPPKVPDGISPTQLFPRRYEVDASNQAKLRQLSGKTITYTCDDQYANDEAQRMFNLDNLMAVSSLSLKKGAQVMMIKNVDETLVNGSLGKVLGFMSESSYKLVQDDIAELPTQDLDLSIDDNGVDEVVKTEKKKAPSKESVSSMEDDVFGIPGEEEVDDDPLNVNWKRKRARLLMLQHNTKTLGTKYPLVRFYLTDGTTRDVLVQPETWTCQDLDGRDIASRTQVPLILAWALSIHKAQGQTLECVKVDLGSTFEKGQAYVAISRATTLSGLQIFRFSRDKVMVHKKVVEFYDSLTSFEDRDQYEPHLESAAPSVKYTRPQANMAQTADKPRMLDRDVYERSNGRKPMSELETNRFKSFSHAVTPPPFMQ